MKKLFTLVMGAFLLAGGLQAQQIKGDFEIWEDCNVWDAINHKDAVVGIQPDGWTASNVSQMGLKGVFVEKAAGHNGGNSAKITNAFVGIPGMGANAPAFITLGKMWVYPDVAGMMGGNDKSDGGVLGGIAFTTRPDSLTLYYKRILGEEKPDETAKIIVYLWKGEFKSQILQPAKGGAFTGEKDTVDVIDQEKCILGKATPMAGSDGVRIGKAECTIEGTHAEWERISIPIEYETEDIPEKMNVIISACNYWVRADLGAGNSLYADDVAFVYNTKLQSLTLGGETVKGFDEDVLEYQLPYADKDKELKAVSYGSTATVDIVSAEEAGQVIKTVTVKCPTSTGVKELVYTVRFKGEVASITNPVNSPELTYGDTPDGLGFTSNSTAPFTYKFSKEGILDFDGTNGKLTAIGVGTVDVIAYQAGNDTHSDGISAPLTVSVKPATVKVSLADGAYCERGKDVSSYNLEKGICGYTLVYTGLKNGDTEAVFTKAVTVTGKHATEPETVGTARAVTLSGAQAENYLFEYAADQKLTITKTTVDVYAKYAKKNIHGGYDDQHELSIPAGLKQHPLEVAYTGFVYDEDASILGDNLPVIHCDVNENTPVGTKVPVTITLPKETENYKFVSKIPADGAVNVLKAPLVTLTETYDKTYGDPVSSIDISVTKDDGTTSIGFSFVNKNSKIAYIKAKTTDLYVVAAGKAAVVITTNEDAEYAPVVKNLTINVSKAPITVKVTPASAVCKVGEALPEFSVEYPNLDTELKNEDTKESVIIAEPAVDLAGVTTEKAGTFKISVSGGELNANYQWNANNAQLKVEDPNSVNNVDEQSAIFVYPNPATDGIRVAGAEAGSAYSINNVAGAIVKQGELSDSAISISDLSNGIYFLKVNGQILKFIKK